MNVREKPPKSLAEVRLMMYHYGKSPAAWKSHGRQSETAPIWLAWPGRFTERRVQLTHTYDTTERTGTQAKLERLRQHHAAGIVQTPVRGKAAIRDDWSTERLPLDVLEGIYAADPDLNIGGLMGEVSNDLVDIDLDCPEALDIAHRFLSSTDAVFGKASTPRAHSLYRVPGIETEPFHLPILDGVPGGMIVEMRSKGAQTVLPGSRHPSGEPIDWASPNGLMVPPIAPVDGEALRQAVGLIATTVALGRHYPPEGTRHAFELAVAGSLLKASVPPEAVVNVIDGLAIVAGIPVDGSAAATVRSTQERIDASEYVTGWPTLISTLGPAGRRLVGIIGKWLRADLRERLSVDDFYAILPQHKYLHRPTRELWEAAGVNGAVPRVEGLGRPVPASVWLDTHRPIHQMTWMPGEPEVLEDVVMREGGLHPHPGSKVYNTYLAPEPNSGDAAAAGPWLDHVKLLYPDDREHIIQWFAQRVQRPSEKINHAIVLAGAPGIGKDALIEPVVQAVGPWNVGEVSPSILGERFNPYLKNAILRVSEARDLGDVDRYALYEKLKPIIAAPPDTSRIDSKYVGEFRIPNVIGVIFTTNHRTGGLYLPPDDRRHYVAWSDARAEDFLSGYFDTLFQWYRDGGFDHVHAYLSTLDLAGFDPKAPPTKTEAFWAMVDAERSPEEGELADIFDTLKSPAAVTLKTVIAKAPEFSEVWTVLSDRKARRRLPHLFAAVGYRPVRSTAKDGYWVIGGRRQVVYARDELALREQIAAAQRLAEGTGR